MHKRFHSFYNLNILVDIITRYTILFIFQISYMENIRILILDWTFLE